MVKPAFSVLHANKSEFKKHQHHKMKGAVEYYGIKRMKLFISPNINPRNIITYILPVGEKDGNANGTHCLQRFSMYIPIMLPTYGNGSGNAPGHEVHSRKSLYFPR